MTSRTRRSALWFVNNPSLEAEILGIFAKYSNKHEVKLYAFGIEGNHIHHQAKFPKANRAHYARDALSMAAKAVQRYYPETQGGGVWQRRYSAEYLADPEDIEEYFFYIALQPVNDGLVDKISDYPGYNFFNDAISGIKRKFKLLNRTKYYKAIKNGKKANINKFYEEFELSYERIPGYEHLSQSEYKKLMLDKLEVRRQEILSKRAENNKRDSLGKDKLLKVKPGSLPRKSKKTGLYGHRPRVLSVCNERRHALKTWYFNIYFEYKEASRLYREGDYSVRFPPGTYKPPKFTCACVDTLASIMTH